ncbi:ABC transporter substrate-binding protein [Pseudorhodoferax sp. Leaf267]|uniref:ABC transporter substrate-binding protein n=1 Tax=Pseudorhodoferax sp. Leaf267 TaxID=1736316 RepID=UPI0006F708F9|nr:ABC transporter substrate-binding protein [Pseudorhodoferax sp. Leaf267]KQP13171.1 branched-chain amino acid ABC transporter substrate-binding protein [Pseudorhodoferax sp. Leaf267]
MTQRRTLVAALAVALVAIPALAQKKYDTGATDTEIKLGMAMPYSGPVSSYGIVGKVNEAYFRMVNDKGGINGRKVTLISYDDQYTPPRTTEVVRKLVEQDEVLAVYGNLGSASNAAIMRYMNAKKVPHLFLGVGADRFNDPKGAPWTTPYMPSYEGEGALYAKNILKTAPDAKIAVLYQNDDFGKDLLKGLKKGLGDKAGMVVAEASFEIADPTVDSQIIKLQASGADVFVNFATARFAAQAIRKVWDIGWRPRQQYLTYVSAYVKMTLEPAGLDKSKGIMAMAFFKDAVQPRWAGDPATQEFLAFMKKYAPNEDVNNAAAVYGYGVAQAMEQVLKSSGDDLTRANVLKQATNLKNLSTGMLLPGIAMNTTPTDYWPFSALQLVQFNGKEFEPMGQSIAVK